MKTRFLVTTALVLAMCVATHARKTAAAGTCNGDGLLTIEANAPLLSSGVLTQLNVSSLFATSSQPTSNLVTVVVRNNSDETRSFRLLFELKMIPSNPDLRASCADPVPEQGGEGCWVQRGILIDQTIAPRSVWIRTSSQLESESYQGKSIVPESSPFQKMFQRLGHLPPGAIYLNVGLLCPLEGRPQEDLRTMPTGELDVYSGVNQPLQRFLANFQPTQAPTPLLPGAPASEGFQAIGTNTPTFLWSGNLDGVDLGGESPYRFSIWELRNDQELGEALSNRPLHTIKVDRSPMSWNHAWGPLESGKRYIWRVDALARGLTSDWLPSTPFGFRAPQPVGASQGAGSSIADGPEVRSTLGVSAPPGAGGPQPTPEQLEILRALSLIIGPWRPALDRAMRTSLPDPNGLTISGMPATRTEFQNLVRDILEGRATVVGAEATP